MSTTGRITSRPTRSPNFTKETGIAVTYDVYDGNEVLEAKLLAGHSGYDIVVPSASPYHGAADRGRRLPRARQGEAAQSEEPRPADRWRWSPPPIPATRTACRICGASPASATTRRWSTRALGEAAPRDSLALLFDPAYAEKLAACGISLLDTPQEVFPAALAYLGLDPKSRDPADLDKAIALIETVRPYVRKFHSSQYINDLATGDHLHRARLFGRCDPGAQPGARSRERGRDRVPGAARGGADVGRHAGHPGRCAASRQRARLYRLSAAAARSSPTITNAVSYPNPNLAATPLVKPEIRDDPASTRREAVRRLLYIDLPAPRAYERARTRAWTRIKSGC